MVNDKKVLEEMIGFLDRTTDRYVRSDDSHKRVSMDYNVMQHILREHNMNDMQKRVMYTAYQSMKSNKLLRNQKVYK